MNLLLLISVPLITTIAILLMRNATEVKWVALIGATLQFVLAFGLLFLFRYERMEGNTAQMLFELQYNWFPAWHISFHLGVDGISVAMILLTTFVQYCLPFFHGETNTTMQKPMQTGEWLQLMQPT